MQVHPALGDGSCTPFLPLGLWLLGDLKLTVSCSCQSGHCSHLLQAVAAAQSSCDTRTVRVGGIAVHSSRNWAALSKSELGIKPLLCHHRNGGPFFPKTHRWSHGYISAFISPCTHTVALLPRAVQTPKPPAAEKEGLSSQGAQWGLTPPEKIRSLECPSVWKTFSLKSFTVWTLLLSVLFLPTKNACFQQRLEKGERKGLDMSKATIITAPCDRHRGRWLLKFLRQTDNDR